MASKNSSTPEASKAPTESTQVETQTATKPAGFKEQSPFAQGQQEQKKHLQQEAPKEQAPDYLDIEAYGNRLVPTKVDGQEANVSLAELVKGYQTNKHNTQKAQELAAQQQALPKTADHPDLQARFDALEQKLMGMQPQGVTQPVGTSPETPQVAHATDLVSEEDKWMVEALDPYLKQLLTQKEAEIQAKLDSYDQKLSTLDQFSQALQPQIVDNNFQQADAMMRQEGFTDLLERRTDLENMYTGLSPELKKNYDDGIHGITRLYKDMKLKELASGVAPVASQVSVQGSGGQQPSQTDTDDYNQQYIDALARAKANAEIGRTAGNMQELLQLQLGDKL